MTNSHPPRRVLASACSALSIRDFCSWVRYAGIGATYHRVSARRTRRRLRGDLRMPRQESPCLGHRTPARDMRAGARDQRNASPAMPGGASSYSHARTAVRCGGLLLFGLRQPERDACSAQSPRPGIRRGHACEFAQEEASGSRPATGCDCRGPRRDTRQTGALTQLGACVRPVQPDLRLPLRPGGRPEQKRRLDSCVGDKGPCATGVRLRDGGWARADSDMQGGRVDALLDVGVDCPAIDQLEVEVSCTAEDRLRSGLPAITGNSLT